LLLEVIEQEVRFRTMFIWLRVASRVGAVLNGAVNWLRNKCSIRWADEIPQIPKNMQSDITGVQWVHFRM